jgi:hypothetical protein
MFLRFFYVRQSRCANDIEGVHFQLKVSSCVSQNSDEANPLVHGKIVVGAGYTKEKKKRKINSLGAF